MSKFIKSKKYIGVFYKVLTNGDKSYYITYKLNNKFSRIHVGKYSEGIREDFCHQLRNEAINKTKFGDNEHIIKTKTKIIYFDELAQKFLEHNKLHAKDYKNHLSRYNNHIKPYLANKSIFDITTDDIRQIQSDKRKTLADKTINHITQLISTVYNYNIKNKFIKIDNPVENITKFKVNNERLRYLDKKEVFKLLDIIKGDEQLLLFTFLALQTGARANTLVNIRKKDIDITNNIVSLHDFKNNSFYKGFFNQKVSDLLTIRIKHLKSNDLILLYNTNSNNLQTYITKKLQPILNSLFNTDLDPKDRQNRVVIHTLRHTFASHLAINGTPIFTIQKLMNHKDITMTMRYAKLAPDSGKEAVNELYK